VGHSGELRKRVKLEKGLEDGLRREWEMREILRGGVEGDV
jgi:hypothetical protein